MRMRSRFRASVLVVLTSTSVATWLAINRPVNGGGPVTPAAPASPAAVPTTVPTVLARVLLPATAPAASQPATAASQPAPASATDTTAVKRGSLSLTFDLDGVFEPVDPFEVKLKLKRYQGDLIIKKAAASATTVAKGDTLLEIDPEKIDIQIAAAENELKLAVASLNKAKSDVKLGDDADALAMTMAKQELASAQDDLKRWDAVEGPAAVLAGGMQERETQAGLDDAVDELNELKKMYKTEDLTNQTADIVMKRAVRSVEIQKTSEELAKAAADRAQHVAPAINREHLVNSVTQQTQSVAQLEASQAQEKVVRATSLVTAQQATDEAQKKLDELHQDKAQFTVTSPIAGMVAYGSFAHGAWAEIDPDRLAAGEKLTADATWITVYTPGKLKLETEWPESQISLYQPGLKVKIIALSMPDQVYDGKTGAITHFSGTAKQDGQAFDVPIALPDVAAALEPGYKAVVSIDAGKHDNVLLLPLSAVYHNKVWMHRDGADDEAKTVVPGQSDGKMIEIKSGLNEGDSVLTQAKRPGQGQ